MAALPEKFSLWSRLKGFFVRPHVIRLNVAWEAGLAVAVLAVALTFQGRQMPVVQHHAKAAAPVIHTRFTVKAPHAKRVSLAGDFNNWRHNELRLLKAEAKGVWTVTVPLSPGRYKYMFVVDGKQWQTDPLAESHEQDGFGNKNAVVEVGPPERLSV
jgi:1,4-alpha-glucan branching enzyme